tara:strand:+ start:992 stop:1978 length:987 start_codon:yes stop_codon:yes gene_type:complete
MNLIIPMAGKGTRLRPQTLVTPKPLIEIAGKTIVQRIVELIIEKTSRKIEKISFIIESKDVDIENQLALICRSQQVSHSVFYQGKPRGTAHAIYCAKENLKGPSLIVFADTLFEADFNFSTESDGCVFVKHVENPRAYGVVKKNNLGHIEAFIEKPTTDISNLAIVGMYYFKEGVVLTNAIQHILKNNLIDKGEYQITTALENLKNQGIVFITEEIKKWFDFGNPQNLLNSHHQILAREKPKIKEFNNVKIIPPCYIGEGVRLEASVIGPNVSIGQGAKISSCNIKNTIIQSNSNINGAELENSIIGKHVEYSSGSKEVNIGDYSTFK